MRKFILILMSLAVLGAGAFLAYECGDMYASSPGSSSRKLGIAGKGEALSDMLRAAGVKIAE